MPVSELDAIQENNRGSLDMCGNCLRAMFLWWLRNGDATASKLARAVYEVGERSAEEKISREFGKLMVTIAVATFCCVFRGGTVHTKLVLNGTL